MVRDVSWERQALFSGLTQVEEGAETNLQPPKGQLQLPVDRQVVMFPPGAFCEENPPRRQVLGTRKSGRGMLSL